MVIDIRSTPGVAAVVFLLLCALVVSCNRATAPQQTVQPFVFAQRIGWFHGPCLAISTPDLAAGTPLTLVIAAEPQTLQQARIRAVSDSPANCPALMEGRAAGNRTQGTVFYALEGNVGPSDIGFGILTPPAPAAILNGVAQMDLDGDGKQEVFSTCSTNEGIRFAVWTEKPYQGDARWSAYYYMDYDLTPTCP
jgi:hypothetical protein